MRETEPEIESYGIETGRRVYVRIWLGRKLKILVVLNKGAKLPNDDWRDTGWGIPGGGMQDDESPAVAAIREVREEVGGKIADAIESKLVYIKPIKKWKRDRGGRSIVGGDYITHHLFEAEIDEEMTPECGADPANIVVEAKWVEPQDLHQPTPHQKVFLESSAHSEDGENSFRVYRAAIDLVMSAK